MRIYRSRVPIPLYLGYLDIILCVDLNQAARSYSNYNLPKDVDYNKHGAFVESYTDKDGQMNCGVFISPNCSLSLIVHEAVHIKNLIFLNISHTQDPRNDEPEAYLMGWIVDQIEEVYIKSANKL